MERYTCFENGKWCLRVGKTEHSGPWVDRLAAYEDTGLEPCDYAAVRAAHDQAAKAKTDLSSAIRILGAYSALGTVEELSALVKARDEGRMHIDPPPAKEGDPKPSCFYEDGGSLWCLGLSHEGDDEPIDRCKQCWYCESGDYADDRAEAEAAIGGVQT